MVDVFGPIIFSDYGFTIHYELSKACRAELFNSISNGVGNMKTMKIAYEVSSFAASEINKYAREFKDKQEYFQQIIELTKVINHKFKLKK